MRSKYIFIFLLQLITATAFAQETVDSYISKSRSFASSGDYGNALLIINKGLATHNDNIDLLKELTYTYYQAERYKEAAGVAQKIAEKDNIDVQAVQIAGIALLGVNAKKEFEALYKKGFKLFPESGNLYATYGEFLLGKESATCIDSWKKGIEVDPSCSSNYYHATKYFVASNRLAEAVWCAENFINLESLSARTVEIKKTLFASLKQMLTTQNFTKQYAVKNNAFFAAYLSAYEKALQAVNTGINTETLILIRTRFILIWQQDYTKEFPSKLLDYHRQLLGDDCFAAYNQWVFGSVENFSAYQNWLNTHQEEQSIFSGFTKNRVFKIPNNQYYLEN
jgi:tetratricopeptide (TPR) repeat protein